MEIIIHKCANCGVQVVYSMFGNIWKHTQKTDCQTVLVEEKTRITK